LIEQDQWNVRHFGFEGTVPVDEIITALARQPQLHNGDEVYIPLHEHDSAELSGNYLIHRPYDAEGEPTKRVEYYDINRDDTTPIHFPALKRTYPGYLLRFWHPLFTLPEAPSYLESGSAGLWETAGALAPTETTVPPRDQRSKVDGTQFFDDLEAAVELNRDATRADARAAYQQKGARGFERERKAVTQFIGRGVLTLRDSTLRLGSDRFGEDLDLRGKHGLFVDTEVLVDSDGGRSQAGFPFDGVVTEVDDSSVEIAPDWATSDDPDACVQYLKGNSYVSVAALLNPVPFDRRRNAIEAIRNTPARGKRGVVIGRRPLRFDSVLGASLTAVDPPLNDYQRSAGENALRAEDLYCVHGPPGTGKSRTARAIIRQAVRSGLTVLVCSQSNAGVDNVITGTSTLADPDSDSLHAAARDGDLTIARMGRGTENRVIEAHYTDNNPATADVVATTTNGAAGLGDQRFDLAVVDEAAQASIPQTLIPYVRSDRLVLIGDDKQLPPFSPNGADQAGGEVLNRSLFEHVLNAYVTRSSQLLKRQYRMNETIAEFSSEQFYNGKLEHGAKNENWTLNRLDPLVGIDISGEERRDGTSPYNETEAECVARRAQRLVNQDVDPASIGVIAMYASQCDRIERHLSRAGITGVDVSTVDSFQGSERAAIIVSFVRSNAANETGFLTQPGDGPRRLNVAVTRAQKRLEFVGDWETLRTCGEGRDSARDRSDLYEALYRYLTDHGRVIASPRSLPAP
jgi:hypothetical protein